jgi:addiction module HigA family antidote
MTKIQKLVLNACAAPAKLPPITPGELLRDVLEGAQLSANAAALKMRLPANRLTAILNGHRAITADTALRLARLFNTSALMWMNMQAKYDLEVAEDQLAERIQREVETLPAQHAAL